MNNRNGLIVVIVLLLVIIAGLVAVIFIPNKSLAPSDTNNGQATTTKQGSAADPNDGSDSLGTGVDTGVGDGSAPTSNVAFIEDLIEVKAPLRNANISSPLTISGNARGRWYFEASAPVELQDAQGNVIAQGHITAQGDWMTEDFVPFTATLTFTKQPAGSTGTLVLQNDNPSGDPARGFELDIPVKF